MKLASINQNGQEIVCICIASGYASLDQINQRFGSRWPVDIWTLLQSGEFSMLKQWYSSEGLDQLRYLGDELIPTNQATFGPLYRHPRKIRAIGLNYKEHAADVSAEIPEEPTSFMKPDTAIIGHGDYIEIPRQSSETHAEAELGIVIGKQCKNVDRENWLDVVAGFTTTLDMTTMDILRRSFRYLARAKSFDTFLAFSPQLPGRWSIIPRIP